MIELRKEGFLAYEKVRKGREPVSAEGGKLYCLRYHPCGYLVDVDVDVTDWALQYEKEARVSRGKPSFFFFLG